jgi:hypothetical protein
MSVGENAPQFFCAGIQGSAGEGPVMILSFGTPIPSEDHSTRKYLTNVRIAMPISAVKNMIDFLNGQLAKGSEGTVPTHSMPDRPQ